MPVQVRDKTSGDKRWWAPERDITVLFPNALRATFYVMSGSSDKDMHQQLYRDSEAVGQALDVSNEELAAAAKIYAKLVSCVELRTDVSPVLNELVTWSPRTRAVLGMVLLHLMTDSFCKHYKSTLHKGEEDPNVDLLRELRALLQEHAEERTKPWWRKIGRWVAQLPGVSLLRSRSGGC